MPVQGPGNMRTGVYPKTAPDAISQLTNLPGVGDVAQTAGGLGPLLAQLGGPALLANPWVGLGLTLGGGLIDSFLDNPYDKARKELVKERQQRIADTRRKARGQFNPAETQQITNNPALEAITESVGQAGLDQSSVGQNILAQSAQQAFLQEQQLATAELNDLELSTYDMLTGMIADDPGFGELLGNISNFAQHLQTQGRQDAAFDQAMNQNQSLIQEFQLLIEDLRQVEV